MRIAATIWFTAASSFAMAYTPPPDHDEAKETLHQPRYGGQFGDADDLYHYEVLLKDVRQLVLYVNDELNRPLDVRHLSGQWTLDPDGASPVRGAFTPSEDGAYFLAHLPPTEADLLHVEVAVLKGRQWVRMEFYLPAPPHALLRRAKQRGQAGIPASATPS